MVLFQSTNHVGTPCQQFRVLDTNWKDTQKYRFGEAPIESSPRPISGNIESIIINRISQMSQYMCLKADKVQHIY